MGCFLHYTNCDYNCSVHSLNKLPIYCFTLSLLTNAACLKIYITESSLVNHTIYCFTVHHLLPPQHAIYKLTPCFI